MVLQFRMDCTCNILILNSFSRYMKYYCNSSLSWGENGTGDHIIIPSPLPHVEADWKQEVFFSYFVLFLLDLV